ncbi:MAG: glutamate synthase large subunit, partial [Acidobacteria bacterium]
MVAINGSDRTRFSLYNPRLEHDACGVGFVADLRGRPSQRIVQMALEALIRLGHRGAADADAATGDGAGLLCQLPAAFFRHEMAGQETEIPEAAPLAVGMCFLPREAEALAQAGQIVSQVLKRRGFRILGWRTVPTRDEVLGKKAAETRPEIRQVLAIPSGELAGDELERVLFVARKEIERRWHEIGLTSGFICSLSHRTIVYKGLLNARQLNQFYPDLHDPNFQSALAIFHQRYSTNTFPNWFLAQPFRLLAHNGEINTIEGNRHWMRARQSDVEQSLWADEAEYVKPVIWAEGSDSASLDNVAELLVRSGRDLLHTMMMLIPEAHEQVPHLDPAVRAFYQYHEGLMEPWDGPAALVFSDGQVIGAALDRNGLRPLRYVVTDDGLVIVASEVGVADLEPERIVENGRLGPGQMLALDLRAGLLLENEIIKETIARRRPYGVWIERQRRTCPAPAFQFTASLPAQRRLQLQRAFGYSIEDVKYILSPMSRGEIPVGSMGDDTPLAPFSTKPRLLYSYFKQRFAQVTNPPIDPLRERLVMALETLIGPRANVFQESEDHARLIKLNSPILTENQMTWLMDQAAFPARVLDVTFPVEDGTVGFRRTLEALCRQAEEAIGRGATLLVLSDRAVNAERAAIPMLLAVGAVHHHLIRRGLRMRASLIVESAEPRQAHEFACLLGYGANAIYPYLAYDVLRSAVGESDEVALSEALEKYVHAVEKELLKIMSKMGISTLSSYCGAQIFEAVGLDRSVIETYFTHTPSLIGGVQLDDIVADALFQHRLGFGHERLKLEDYGYYRYRRAGEYHMFNPDVVRSLHKFVRSEEGGEYGDYARRVRERPAAAIRDLLEFRPGRPIPVEEVEPVEEIVKRFCAAAMSHGALSRETHETIAIAMNRLGARSNSGEGGEDPRRYRPLPNGDSANSAIKQVASARFGVTPAYLMSADELEIKMAQGSKPGEGGQLPGHKVTEEIAAIRHSGPGITLISPPPHHDIYSIEDLAQLIYDLRRVNPRARIAVKLVAEAGVGTVAAGVAKAHADVIHISGHAGGTGASPLGSIKNAGVPWELGLAEAHQVLTLNGLRDRVRLRVDGGLQTGRDVIIAALLGADEFAFGTAALVALGCVMARQCHLNTCPVGIATQREDLRKRFPGKPEMLVRFFRALAEDVRHHLARLGFRRLDDIVGRADLLRPVSAPPDNVRGTFDLSPLLTPVNRPSPGVQSSGGEHRTTHQSRRRVGDHAQATLDDRVYHDALPALEAGRRARFTYRIRNTDRTVGARLAGEIARRWGDEGLPEGTIEAHFRGTAGQSFGAFCISGLRLILEGDANDYVGKSMAGGQIVIRPPAHAPFARRHHTIVGNTVLYG